MIRLSKAEAKRLGIKVETTRGLRASTVHLDEYENKFNVAQKEDRTLGGVLYASRGEMIRYYDLQQQEKSGQIRELCRQVPFVVIPSFDYFGKTISQVRLVVDFTYNEGDKWIIEDFKGKAQKDWIIKWKLLQYQYKDSEKVVLRISTKEDIRY